MRSSRALVWRSLLHILVGGHTLHVLLYNMCFRARSRTVMLDKDFMRRLRACTVVLAELSLTLPAGMPGLKSALYMPC